MGKVLVVVLVVLAVGIGVRQSQAKKAAEAEAVRLLAEEKASFDRDFPAFKRLDDDGLLAAAKACLDIEGNYFQKPWMIYRDVEEMEAAIGLLRLPDNHSMIDGIAKYADSKSLGDKEMASSIRKSIKGQDNAVTFKVPMAYETDWFTGVRTHLAVGACRYKDGSVVRWDGESSVIFNPSAL